MIYTGLFSGALLATDVDETLVYNGFSPENNIEKIKFFKENGGKVILASGRAFYALDNIKDYLEIFDYSVLSNGSMIYDFLNKNVIYAKTFSKIDKDVLKEILDTYKDIGIHVNTTKGLFVLNNTIESQQSIAYENKKYTLTDFSSIYNEDWVKVVYCCKNESQPNLIDDIIKNYNLSSYFVKTTQYINKKIQYFYEQMPCGATKAEAIKQVLDIYKIKKGNFYAIGDYFNDIDMLKYADVSACPKDSPDEVKSICNYITVSAENGSVADFIDYLTNKKKGTTI